MSKLNKLFLSYLSLVIFVACSSVQKTEKIEPSVLSGAEEYLQWEAKALVKNNKTGEANILSLDIIGKKPFPVRAEVSTSMGIHVASVLILEDEIQFLLPKSKKYYSGTMSPKSLKPILNVSLDPRLIVASLFDEATFPDWNCRAEEGKVIDCETPNHDKIEWFSKKEESGKRVDIKGENYEAQFQIKSQKIASSIKENTFILKIPDNFKSYKLVN
jgi:hypothetical protein